jgi:hypothetical protein
MKLELTLQDCVLGPTTWTVFTRGVAYRSVLELVEEECSFEEEGLSKDIELLPFDARTYSQFLSIVQGRHSQHKAQNLLGSGLINRLKAKNTKNNKNHLPL